MKTFTGLFKTAQMGYDCFATVLVLFIIVVELLPPDRHR